MAYNAFLLIPGIPGTSTNLKHKEQIQIESFSWGAANSVAEPPVKQNTSSATATRFTFAKIADIASPLLFQAVVESKIISTVTLSLQRASGGAADAPDFMTVLFSNVVISEFTSAGPLGADAPSESVAFVYGALQISYVPTVLTTGKPGTPVTAKWDFETNTIV